VELACLGKWELLSKKVKLKKKNKEEAYSANEGTMEGISSIDSYRKTNNLYSGQFKEEAVRRRRGATRKRCLIMLRLESCT